MKKILLILVLLVIVTGCNSKTKNEVEVKYTEITYMNEEENACITFRKDGNYSLYDCDSEPTNYFFDSENECKYSYDGSKMTFDCKYKRYKKNNYIIIKEWNEDKFEFTLDGKLNKFKAIII